MIISFSPNKSPTRQRGSFKRPQESHSPTVPQSHSPTNPDDHLVFQDDSPPRKQGFESLADPGDHLDFRTTSLTRQRRFPFCRRPLLARRPMTLPGCSILRQNPPSPVAARLRPGMNSRSRALRPENATIPLEQVKSLGNDFSASPDGEISLHSPAHSAFRTSGTTSPSLATWTVQSSSSRMTVASASAAEDSP